MIRRLISGISVSVALTCAAGVQLAAQQKADTPIIEYAVPFHPTYATRGMVVSQEYNASEAGKQIIADGGNAIDAAVATGFALAVTHPQAGNLGGGGFMMVYLAAEKRVIAIDYREKAPAAAFEQMFQKADGTVDNQKARFSLQASGVPGTVAGLLHAHAQYGRLPLADVMAPAITLAEKGFPMPFGLAESLRRYQKRLGGNAAAKAYYTKAGGFKPGDLWQQPDLARTLKLIAKEGRDGFYKGAVADKIVATMQADNGLITHADLAAYEPVERDAVRGTYKSFEIAAMPPPSSGGVHIIQMLNVLEGYNLPKLGFGSAAYIHRLTETMKYAYADRSKYLGDPDYYDVPVAALTDKAYAAHIRSRIKPDRATPSDDIKPAPKLPFESPDTTHFSAVDQAGNMVANTYTLNFSYGNGKAVAGAGFLLNNEMDDFSAKPGVPNAFGLIGGEANSIQAGKRPLSSMTPVLVFKDGKPYLASGSPGGSTIITVTLQTILNVMAFDMNIMEATAAPRIHHQWYPDYLMMEPGISPDTRRALKALGHNLPMTRRDRFSRVLGATQSVLIDRSGLLHGAPDPRRPGSHAAAW